MRSYGLYVIGALVLLSCLTAPSLAGTPPLMNYQARVTDGAGLPFDTVVSISFSLYANPTGPPSLWSETHTSDTIKDGILSVTLGTVNPLTHIEFGGSFVWLGITIGADPELSPRTRMAPCLLRLESAQLMDHPAVG